MTALPEGVYEVTIAVNKKSPRTRVWNFNLLALRPLRTSSTLSVLSLHHRITVKLVRTVHNPAPCASKLRPSLPRQTYTAIDLTRRSLALTRQTAPWRQSRG